MRILVCSCYQVQQQAKRYQRYFTVTVTDAIITRLFVPSCRLIDRHGTVLDIRASPFQSCLSSNSSLAWTSTKSFQSRRIHCAAFRGAAGYLQGDCRRYHAGIHDDNWNIEETEWRKSKESVLNRIATGHCFRNGQQCHAASEEATLFQRWSHMKTPQRGR